MIMNQLRANVKPDLLPHSSNIGSSGTTNASNKPTGEDDLIENHPESKIRTNSAPPQTKTSTVEFHLRYIGSMEISHSSITEKFLNTTAAKFREAYSKKQKEKKKKKRKTTKTFTTLNSPGTVSLTSFDSVDFPISEPPQSITRDAPESSKYVLPTSAEEAGSPKGEGQTISVEVTRATPDRDEKLLPNKEGIETLQKGENDSGITTDDGVTEPTANEPTSSEQGCEQVGEEEESQSSPKDEKAPEETDGSAADYREPQRPRSLCTEEVMVMMGSQNYQDKEDDMGEEEEQELVNSVAAITVRKRSLTVVPSENAESEEDKSVTSAGAQVNEAMAQDTQPSQEKEQEEEGEKEQEGKPVEGKKSEEVVADNFDTLPELDVLHDSPEFQKLGIPKDLPGTLLYAADTVCFVQWLHIPSPLLSSPCTASNKKSSRVTWK